MLSSNAAVSAPSFHLLTPEHIAAIQEATLKILESTGMRIEHEIVLQRLAAAGAIVQDQVAKFPRDLVHEALRNAPKSIRLAGRTEDDDIVLELGGKSYCRPVGGLNHFLDYGCARRREARHSDVENWIRVASDLPNIHVVNSILPFEQSDVYGDVSAVRMMIEHTSKPLMLSGFGGENTRWIAEMLGAVSSRPVPRIMFLSSVNSPLTYAFSQVDTLLAAGELGLPVHVNSSAMTGATGPITLAGSLLILNTEIIGGITTAQILNPGAPVVHAGHPVVFDMQTGLSAFGYSEAGLLAAGIVELGKSYGLPVASNGVTCDAAVPDEQAAMEKYDTAFLALIAGACISGGAGSLAAVSTGSLEQLVLDGDLYGRMLRSKEGIDFSGDRLGLECIQQVGPFGHFLESEHTLDHLRGEYNYLLAVNRISAPIWEEQGAKDVLKLAHEKVLDILSQPPKQLVDSATVERITIIERRAAEALTKSQ